MISILFLIFICGFNFNLSAAFAEEKSYTLEPIVIVPTKSSLSEFGALRKINIISKEEIQRLPAHSVPQLLTHILGVDIRQRGAEGVQADVSMHGSNFEQILICLNGVRINDPQTGHHNMDLPVTLADIERIEVLPGSSSSIYGHGAFSGAINIVTKKPEGTKLEMEASGGDFGLNSQALSLTYPLGDFSNRLSFTRKNSYGWRPETFFNTTSLSFNSQREFDWGAIEYLFGYTTKDFGADSFYSNLYPHEEEHTDTRFFNLKAHIQDEVRQLRSNFYYRRHSDKFILDRTRPSWSVNYHTSYSWGADLEGYINSPFGPLLVGVEASEEKITSTNIGEHSRGTQSLYTQFQSSLYDAFDYNLGLRLDHYQKWGWQTSPALNIGCKISPQLRWKGSVGRSFRIPSFTELYYSTSANIGNENLTPEKAWSGETGLVYNKGIFDAELTYFRRWANDLIGWLRSSPADAWEAQNIGEVDAQGLELELKLRPQIEFLIPSEISAGYIYQHLESESTTLNTKYTLNFLKHHARLGLNLSLPWEFAQSLSLSYKQRINQRHYFLLDGRLSKKFEKDGVDYEIFLDITNLFNTSYSEQGAVTMPGRWIMGGMRVRL